MTTPLADYLLSYLAQVAPGMALTALVWVVGATLFALALLREGARYYADASTSADADTASTSTDAADADAAPSSSDERDAA